MLPFETSSNLNESIPVAKLGCFLAFHSELAVGCVRFCPLLSDNVCEMASFGYTPLENYFCNVAKQYPCPLRVMISIFLSREK